MSEWIEHMGCAGSVDPLDRTVPGLLGFLHRLVVLEKLGKEDPRKARVLGRRVSKGLRGVELEFFVQELSKDSSAKEADWAFF